MNDGKSILERSLDWPRVEAALRRATREALIRHKLFGHPIVVWEDGKVVEIPADQIVIPDEPDGESSRPMEFRAS